MFTVAYRCTQCPLIEKWYELARGDGRPREFATLHEAARAANNIASLRGTMARVLNENGGIVWQVDQRRIGTA